VPRNGRWAKLFAVLGGLSSIHHNRNEVNTSIELGQQMLRIAKSGNNRVSLLWAHYTLGFGMVRLGEYHSAREHLEQSLALYERARGGSYGFVQDPGPTCLLQLAFIVHRLGYPDLAARKALEGLQLARELAHPFTLAWVLNNATIIHMQRGEERESRELCDENVILCTNYGFDFLLTTALILQGCLMVRQGGIEGIIHIREGLAMVKEANLSSGLGLLAEAHRRLGQSKEGLEAVTEALIYESHGDDRSQIAWLNRLKGDLLAQEDETAPDAMHFYRESIAIARKQSDKSQELETTIALSRLLAKKNRQKARKVLAQICNWFTEGFDTADLIDARALLNQLGS
jgi:tetratricopeptide (TPR) repeat protein